MPTRLARWVCVLTALAAGSTFAADKPKEKKGKPATPVVGAAAGAVIGQATGNPKTGAVVGPINGGLIETNDVTPVVNEADKQKGKPVTPTLLPGSDLPPISLPAATPKTADSKFVITKPVGTWVRDVNIGDAAGRFTLEVTDSRLVLKIDAVHGKQTVNGRVSVDYSINKESTLFGVIDSCEVKSSEKVVSEMLGQFAKLFSGQPFAVRFRMEDDGLTFKDFKGLGVGLSEEVTENITSVLIMLNGRFTKVDPSKPLSPLKVSKKKTGSDPIIRQDQLLKLSESLRKPSNDQQGTDTVKQAGGQFPLPDAPPVVWPAPFPPSSGNVCNTSPVPDVPPLKLPLLPGIEPLKVDPLPATTSAYAGPISGAPVTSRLDATVVQAKSEVSAVEPPRLIPKLGEDDCPACGDAPSDTEVMQRFYAKRLLDGDPSSGISPDDITILKNLVSGRVSEPRFYPHSGICRSQCCHWACYVYYPDPKSGKAKGEVISFETNTVRMMVPAGDTTVPQRMTEK